MDNLSRPKRCAIGALLAAAAVVAGLLFACAKRDAEPVAVVLVTPRGEALATAAVVIRFDHDMVAAEQLGQPAPDQLVRLQPPTPGRFVWRNPRTLVWHSRQRLPMATSLTVHVARELACPDGHALARAVQHQFHTTPLRLEHVSRRPLSGARQALTLIFNDIVRPDRLDKHLALTTPDGAIVSYYVRELAPRRVHELLTARPGRTASLIATLDAELAGESGPLGLGETQTHTLDLGAALTVAKLAPRLDEGEAGIAVRASHPILPEGAEEFIAVDPPVDFRPLPLPGGLELRGPFAPGTDYAVTFRRGLQGSGGAALAKAQTLAILMPDLDPRLTIEGPALHAVGAAEPPRLAVQAVNVAATVIRVTRVAAADLAAAAQGQPTAPAPVVHQRTQSLANQRNEPEELLLDLATVLGDDAAGCFLVEASDAAAGWRRAQQLVQITDLAVTAKAAAAQVVVWLTSRRRGEAVADAAVALYSPQNRLLLEGRTNSQGIVRFENSQWSAADSPFAVVATAKADMAFVLLDEAARPPGHRAFVYSDRAAYRPGDRVHLHAIVRAPGPAMPDIVPIRLVVKRPNGGVFASHTVELSEWGSADLDLALPDFAQPGAYQVTVQAPADAAIVGSHAFQVEDPAASAFRLELTGLNKERYRAGDALRFTVRATRSPAVPAAGAKLAVSGKLAPIDFAPPQLGSYRLRHDGRRFAVRQWSFGEATLDAKGQASFAGALPPDLQLPPGIELTISAALTELGGQRASCAVARPVDPDPTYIELPPPNAGNAPPQGLEWRALQASYQPGEPAAVLVRSPFPGRALVTLEGDRVHWLRTLALTGAEQRLELPLAADAEAGLSAAVTVVREGGSGPGPHRVQSSIPLRLDRSSRRLALAIEAPAMTEPGQVLRVGLRVADAAGRPVAAELTLAALDGATRNHPRWPAPNTWEHFYAGGPSAVRTSANWGAPPTLISGTLAAADDRPAPASGDALAFWRDRIVTDAAGRAEVTFNVPRYSGRLHLVAAAATANSFGQAERVVEVQPALHVSGVYPRFLRTLDEFELRAQVRNNTKAKRRATVQLDTLTGAECLSSRTARVVLAPGQTGEASFRLRAPVLPGRTDLLLKVQSDDFTASEAIGITVKPPASQRFLSGRGSLRAGRTSRLVIPGGWLTDSDSYWLSFSSLPVVKYGRALRSVAGRPFGALEPTVSSAFPLLYLSDLAPMMAPASFGARELDSFVQRAVDRLLAMQTSAGGFAAWPHHRQAHPWGSIYATHFLVEAGKAGYAVPPHTSVAGLDYLEDRLLAARWSPPEVKAYAAYVLALGGRASGVRLAALAEQAEDWPQYSRFHLAAALHLVGDSQLAAKMIDFEALPPPAPANAELLHTPAREQAIMLATYMDVQPDHALVPALLHALERGSADGRWSTTQENAFALVALGKYARHWRQDDSDYRVRVLVDDREDYDFTHHDNILIRPPKVGGREVKIVVEGKGRLYYYWGTTGIPMAMDLPAHDSRLQVRRRYLRRTGEELDEEEIELGELIVVEVAVNARRPLQNLVVIDPAPAGLTVEASYLPAGAGPPPPSGRELQPTRVEVQPDRLLIFANIDAGGAHYYRYLARASSRGAFTRPAISASGLYAPKLNSTHGAGGRIHVR